ncbi:MAG: NADH/ubiquinone/plastoquinone (complex I) [Candidatus Omnitrophica bacterium]|nr:NADH/ubiquinone/plastoquinone (complex I) [Candidatus Omnitrophota bacterium]
MLEIPLLIIVPLLGVFLIVAVARKRSPVAGIISILAICLIIYLYKNVLCAIANSGSIVYEIGGWSMPEGINLIVDGLAVFMLGIVYFISFLCLLYSIAYMKNSFDKWKYYTLFLLLMSGISGVVLAGDIFTLFVFLEISAIASYALVSISLEGGALYGAFGYMRMGMISSVLILLGIAISYNYLSTLSIADVSLQLGIRNQAGNMLLNNNIVIIFISLLFLTGFALKVGLVPFHFWVVDAHAFAPAPVVMMLSALIMPVLGIYPMLRIFFNMVGITPRLLSLMMIMGILSMIIGALFSLREKNIKRFLSYNCISELGFVVLGIGIGTKLAIAGAFLHMISHAISSSLLYASAGAMDYARKHSDEKNIDITFKTMPLTKGASVIGALSVIGIPPFNGFWSKMIIITAAWIAGYKGNCLIIVIVLILNAVSFLKIQTAGMVRGDKKKSDFAALEVPFLMRLCMIILVCFSLFSGILWLSSAREAFLDPAVKLISQKHSYSQHILWK